MIRLSCDKIQRRFPTKPIQSIKKMFEFLGFDNLAEPRVKVEMSTDLHEVFKPNPGSIILNMEENVFRF